MKFQPFQPRQISHYDYMWKLKFRPGKAGQFFTWYLMRFACIFFGFFFVRMSFKKLKILRFPVIKNFFT